MEGNFNETNAIGKRGERLVAAALAARGHQIEDLSGDWEYQQRDTDFRITNKKGVSITLEVKNDIKSNYTGNVFIETYNINNVKRGGQGWFAYCEADYLCFVQEEYKIAHIVDRAELVRNCWSNLYRQKNSYFSRGYIVPIDKLKKYESYFCLRLGE